MLIAVCVGIMREGENSRRRMERWRREQMEERADGGEMEERQDGVESRWTRQQIEG